MSGNHPGELVLPVIEAKVAEIWKQVLDVPDGSEDATFFDLEGESIAAVRLVSRIEEELGVSVDVGDVFEEDPNLDALVRMVAGKAAVSPAA
ncbi:MULTISPECIES: acyl carrier protein [unclassified Microbispora]|uniref:acyl carrier protein n=1 Tax=unclassified Microbispora TaxID=2614687 RepID=UPI001473B90D|nr:MULTISPECIES: acyl carrier protein [unclassified Microbispora]